MGAWAELVRECGSEIRAARNENISIDLLRKRLSQEREYEGKTPVPDPGCPELDPTPEPPVPIGIELRREQIQIAGLKSQITRLEKELIQEQDFRRGMENLYSAKTEKVSWPLATPHIRKGISLTPILFTSDFQCGEVVRAEEIDGLNEYNLDEFCSRYGKMIFKTVNLAEESTGATDFPGIIYLRGGDAISGQIHEELCQTNDLSAIPACKLLFQQEKEGILRLRNKFGKVRVISLPGNHGRTTLKSHSKKYGALNYETMLSWWLASAFESDCNVSFWTPQSADALFQVEGWNFLMSHGDRMGSRGGAGFVGPAATIARGHQKLYQNWTATGQHVDCILTGHLHTSLKLERGYANGSLVGYGEYARDLRALPAPAMQWLLFIHREMMVSHAFELQLSDRPFRSINDESFHVEAAHAL